MGYIPKPLSEKQQLAVELTLAGTLQEDILAQLGISRRTLSRWRNDHSGVMTALKEGRAEQRQLHRDTINSMVDRAVQVVVETMNSPDEKLRFRAAAFALKVSGAGQEMKGDPPPTRQDIMLEILHEVCGEVWNGGGAHLKDTKQETEPAYKPLDFPLLDGENKSG